ncbi:MAG TPA: phosphotransacetylase family protein [Dehalococcoidia bacterium]|nr:phosphotransacetylase family protein [Dehalococcoidia bacterium]
MVALYLTSVEAAGKTALCASIGRKLLNLGGKVGFITPVQLSEASINGYKDATFIKEALELEESTELLCPIRLSRRELWQSLADEAEDFIERIRQAYAHISLGKDTVLIEGLSDLGTDNVSTLACYKIAEVLDARVIVVLRYSSSLTASGMAQVAKELEQRLLGVVINFVPESRTEAVGQDMTALFQEAGINVLGILPEVRSLLGVSVGELAETLDGEILTCPENTGEIVENIMLGAMTPDSGIDYFNRKINKAAVIRGERADMQLAALETSTKCLILTNNLRPLPAVVYRAEDKHVPIMVVKQDTFSVIDGIEEALAKARLRSPQKLQRFETILDRYFDFKALCSELGLKA